MSIQCKETCGCLFVSRNYTSTHNTSTQNVWTCVDVNTLQESIWVSVYVKTLYVNTLHVDTKCVHVCLCQHTARKYVVVCLCQDPIRQHIATKYVGVWKVPGLGQITWRIVLTKKIEGPLGEKIARKSRNSERWGSGGRGHVKKGANWRSPETKYKR